MVEAAASALGEQRDCVEKAHAEAADQQVVAGVDRVEVLVDGVAGADPTPGACWGLVGVGDPSGCVDGRVCGDCAAIVKGDDVACVAVGGDGCGARVVFGDGDAVG